MGFERFFLVAIGSKSFLSSASVFFGGGTGNFHLAVQWDGLRGQTRYLGRVEWIDTYHVGHKGLCIFENGFL